MESYVLPQTKLGLVLCQSAKFRPNGKTYDGEGIEPDIVVPPTIQDFLGESDSVLDFAIQRLRDIPMEQEPTPDEAPSSVPSKRSD